MAAIIRTGIFLVMITVLPSLLKAQVYPASDDSPFIEYSDSVLLTKEISGGFILHSQGWGVEFMKGKNVTFKKKRYLKFNFVEMKSLKEIRVINPYFSNAKSYIYGKLNNVYVLRGGYGHQHLMTTKPYWGGVEFRFFYAGGVSLGMAKPVYLNIITLVSITPNYFEYELTTEKYDPEEHFRDNIYGRASFTKGIGEMKFYPGVFGNVGFFFDFGTYNAAVKALELGAFVDVFPNPIPMMAYNDKEYYFLTLYLCVSFGKRYN